MHTLPQTSRRLGGGAQEPVLGSLRGFPAQSWARAANREPCAPSALEMDAPAIKMIGSTHDRPPWDALGTPRPGRSYKKLTPGYGAGAAARTMDASAGGRRELSPLRRATLPRAPFEVGSPPSGAAPPLPLPRQRPTAARLLQPTRADSIALKVKGFEKAEWTEQRTVSDGKSSHTVADRCEGTHEFLRVKIPMATYQVEIAPGQRAATPVPPPLPRLPPPSPSPPPSFHEERGSYKARICYKLKGVVEVPGLLKPNIKNTAQAIVSQQFAQSITQQKRQLEIELRVCCCISCGRVKPHLAPPLLRRAPPALHRLRPQALPRPPLRAILPAPRGHVRPPPADRARTPPTKLSAIGLLRRPRTDFEALADLVRSVPDAEGQRRLWRELAGQARAYKKQRSLVDQMEGLAASP
eukprot:tig00021036_g17399.t1